MLVPKRNRVLIYSYLFQEGCIVIKDNVACNRSFGKDEKGQDQVVPNIEVIKVLQSLWSREYVKKTYSWCHFYYFLTDAGIEYLRNYLHLTADVVPATLKKQAPVRAENEDRPRRFNGERKTFRRNFRGPKTEAAAPVQA
ncbi:hypothetical protein WA158_007248 [Blastocystis sp. Blastoise]